MAENKNIFPQTLGSMPPDLQNQGQQGQQELVQIMRELEQTQRQMLTELRLIRILFQTLFSGSGNP